MGYELYIPPCIHDPAHPLHPPPLEKPLRISIEGPLPAIEKLLPSITWHTDLRNVVFPQPAAHELAKMTYRAIYGQDVRPEVPGDMIVRDEYLGWVPDDITHRWAHAWLTPFASHFTYYFICSSLITDQSISKIDYYGVTFDHLVPAGDVDPDTLQINIVELETTEGPFANGAAYAEECLLFPVDPADYVGKRVLASHRCCSKRKGTQDRGRINGEVAERDAGRKSGGRAPGDPSTE